MRTHGVLAKWNDERGFGFISRSQGGEEIFVHVSAFPRDGVRPRLNELVSFEVETGPNGKPRAIRIMRPGGQAKARRPTGTSGLIGAILGLLAIAAIGFQAYSRMAERAPIDAPKSLASPVSSVDSRCDGRKMCSQMTSCAEAIWFIRHCPGTKMDGDRDGVPCEGHWCGE
jgi:cold shock CspA family protein